MNPPSKRFQLLFLVIFLLIILTVVLSRIPSFRVLQGRESFELKIERGDSLSNIQEKIRGKVSPLFPLYLEARLRLEKKSGLIRTGTWSIERESRFSEVYQELLEGNEELVRVTIPPGWTLSKIADRLVNLGFSESVSEVEKEIREYNLSEYGFPSISDVSGFLYPETYQISTTYSIKEVLSFLVEQFFFELERIYPDYKNLTDQELLEKISLASIVEGEYRTAEETPIIASVFYNRLRQGIRLESCATILYVLEEEYGEEHKSRLFFSDLQRESLFNTYRHSGLPPKPINNPGQAALRGAFFPADTDYLFFVVDNTRAGYHIFTSNFSSHNAARASYLNGFVSK